MPLGRAAPPVKGQYMNSTGGGLCSVISSTEGETQSLQVRKGGLDRDTTRAISLDDVNVDVTEIVRLPLEVASDIQRAANMAEEFSEEPENETATEMDELSAQFRTSRQELTNSLSTLTLSEMKIADGSVADIMRYSETLSSKQTRIPIWQSAEEVDCLRVPIRGPGRGRPRARQNKRTGVTTRNQ